MTAADSLNCIVSFYYRLTSQLKVGIVSYFLLAPSQKKKNVQAFKQVFNFVSVH